MEVVSVEFCRTKYESPSDCEKWIRERSPEDDLQRLLGLKNFKLKANISRNLSGEARKVWWWGNMWHARQMVVDRPDAYVVVVKKINAGGSWSKDDVPVPLPTTQEKMQKVELARQRRDFKRKETQEKLKQKRKQLTLLKKKVNEMRDLNRPPKKARKLSKKINIEDLLYPLAPSIEAATLAAEKEDADSNDNENLLLQDP